MTFTTRATRNHLIELGGEIHDYIVSKKIFFFYLLRQQIFITLNNNKKKSTGQF